MSKKRSETKGKLMREAEAMIDELLAWQEVEAPDLSQIEGVRWYHQAETSLFQGAVDKIIQSLHKRAQKQPQTAEILGTEGGYFENNKRRMDYLDCREEGYLIGSGMVESGAKQFKARFTGPSKRGLDDLR